MVLGDFKSYINWLPNWIKHWQSNQECWKLEYNILEFLFYWLFCFWLNAIELSSYFWTAPPLPFPLLFTPFLFLLSFFSFLFLIYFYKYKGYIYSYYKILAKFTMLYNTSLQNILHTIVHTSHSLTPILSLPSSVNDMTGKGLISLSFFLI